MTRIGIDFYSSGHRFRLEGEAFCNKWKFKLKQLGGEVDLPKFLAASIIAKTVHALQGVRRDFELDELMYEGRLSGDQDDVTLYLIVVGDVYNVEIHDGDHVVSLPSSLAVFAKERLALTLNNLVAELMVEGDHAENKEKEEEDEEPEA